MKLNDFIFRLSLCEHLGAVNQLKIIRAKIASPEAALATLLKAASISLQQGQAILNQWSSPELDRRVRLNQAVPHILITDEAYPAALKESYGAPTVLYYRGNRELLTTQMLAVVGARQMSSYGQMVMDQLLPPVIYAGITIVSGLARGVDGYSHHIANDHAGKTIAVIGTGLDRFYPREHRQLMQQMMQSQLVLTEYPLGTPPLASHFPARNQIIAGLCQSCLVVEGRQRSGSLITANLALQENRNVLAVPGAINHELSTGCNELIAEGAKPILRALDILEEFT